MLPLDRDPDCFPYGLLLVGPGLFEPVSGFAWFASEAAAIDYLLNDVWTQLALAEDQKQACRHLFETLLTGCDHISDDLLARLGAEQADLLVIWAGPYESIRNGTDDFVMELLSGSDVSNGELGLLASEQGRRRAMDSFRWEFTGGVNELKVAFRNLKSSQPIGGRSLID